MKKKQMAVVVVAVAVIFVVGIGLIIKNAEKTLRAVDFSNTGTTCGNIVMGYGKFAYRDGFVYVSCGEEIIEYDLETGVPAFLKLPSDRLGADNLFLSDTDIYYTDKNTLNRIRRDGKESSTVSDRKNSTYLKLFVDGTDAYFMNHTEGSLFHMDLNTMKETELISKVNAYYADETTIYAVAKDADNQWGLFCSNRESVDFKKIDLSFLPITVYADAQGIFMTEKGSEWQIIRVVDGTETRLPCNGLLYQVMGDKLLYLEDKVGMEGVSPLKSYDLTTGEIKLICKDVYSFCVIEERYIACDLVGEGGIVLIDTQTGETIPVLVEEEK